MKFILDSRSNIIGQANAVAPRIEISNVLDNDGAPCNATRVRVSGAKRVAERAQWMEFIPSYSEHKSGVYVRDDVLAAHESVAQNIARTLAEKDAASAAKRTADAERTMRREDQFQAEITANLG